MKLDNERQTSYDITYTWNQKKKKKERQINLFSEQKQTQTLKNLWFPKETGWVGGRGMEWGFEMEMF